jgi:hypothetical protein
MEYQSIYSFCQEHGISRSTAYRLLQTKGLPTDQGVTKEVRKALEALVTPEEVEAEIVDPLEHYGAIAQISRVEEVSLATRDNLGSVDQYVDLALNAQETMEVNQATLSDHEIKAAIQRGAERGALKSALERQAEKAAYERGMGLGKS